MLVQETNEDMFFIVENVMHIGQNQFHFVLLFTTICHRHQIIHKVWQGRREEMKKNHTYTEEIMPQNITSSSAQHKIV